jgi:rhomboid protease GluP
MTSLLLSLLITFAFASAVLLLRVRGEQPVSWRTLWPVLAVFVVTAAFSGAQFVWPGVLTALQRDPDKLLDGQVWRLVTPLVVRDGGATGTITNLTTLLLLGIPAALLLGPRRWLILYLGTGIASEVVAYTLLQQGFAGNSIADVGLAAGLAVAALSSRRLPITLVGSATLSVGLGLLIAGDLHGAAFWIGVVIARGLGAGRAGGSGEDGPHPPAPSPNFGRGGA